MMVCAGWRQRQSVPAHPDSCAVVSIVPSCAVVVRCHFLVFNWPLQRRTGSHSAGVAGVNPPEQQRCTAHAWPPASNRTYSTIVWLVKQCSKYNSLTIFKSIFGPPHRSNTLRLFLPKDRSPVTHSLTHSPSLTLTHSLTHSHPLTHSLTHSHSLTHTHSHSLTLTHTHSHSLTHSLTRSLTHSLTVTHSLTCSLADSLERSLLHSLTTRLVQLTHS